MSEITKLKHYKENKLDGDYIEVRDRSLNEKRYVKLEDVEYKGQKLGTYIFDLEKEVITLTKELEALKGQLNDLERVVNIIYRGVSSRWKRKY